MFYFLSLTESVKSQKIYVGISVNQLTGFCCCHQLTEMFLHVPYLLLGVMV